MDKSPGGKQRGGRNQSYETPKSPVVTEEELIVSIITYKQQ